MDISDNWILQSLSRGDQQLKVFRFWSDRGDLKTIQYGEILDLVRKRTIEIEKGLLPIHSRSLLIAETSPDFVIEFLATMLAKRTPVPISARSKLLKQSSHDDIIKDIEKSIQNHLSEDDAYVQFSSGTTSNPKGVIHTHQALEAHLKILTQSGLNVSMQDSAVSWLPLSHDMGLVGFLLAPLYASIDINLINPRLFVRSPMRFLEIISEYSGTISYCPSFAYRLLADALKNNTNLDLNLSTWRVAGIGGDYIDHAAVAEFSAIAQFSGFNPNSIKPSYGLAEAVLAVTLDNKSAGLRKSILGSEDTCCGKPIDGILLEIRNSDGTAAMEGYEGNIFVSGNSVSQRSTLGPIFKYGWLDTGDVGYIIDGELYISGRKKSAIKYYGRTIWPERIETLLTSALHLPLKAIVVFSKSPVNDGNIIIACADNVSSSDFEKIPNLIKSNIGINFDLTRVPRDFIKLSGSGKIIRSDLRKKYLEYKTGGQNDRP